jgi:hypothetical protein
VSEIFAGLQSPCRFLTLVRPVPPFDGRLIAGAAHAVRAVEDESIVARRNRRFATSNALTIYVPPGGHGGQLQPDRPPGMHEAMDDANRRSSVQHRQLGLEDDVVELPRPSRHALDQLEADQVVVAMWSHDARPPFSGGQLDTLVVDDQYGIERGQPHVSARRRTGDEQTVVPPCAQATDRSHGEATETIGDEPLAARRCFE